jgi:hypothetical protein
MYNLVYGKNMYPSEYFVRAEPTAEGAHRRELFPPDVGGVGKASQRRTRERAVDT